MRPQDRDEFKEYCLRKLGKPVIDINVDDDQVEDRIDEALHFYQTYHYDAMEHIAIVYELTQEDIDNRYITMPKEIASVTFMIYDGDGMIQGGFGNNLWHSMKNIAYDISFGIGACRSGTGHYLSMMNKIAELKNTFKVESTIEFQYRNHRLYINTDWSKFSVGGHLAFDVYRIIDPDETPDLWSDRSLIEYATCLIGEQWGSNLSKFDGVELPGGITLDGDKLYDRYHDRKLEIEEDWQLKWEEPVQFLVG